MCCCVPEPIAPLWREKPALPTPCSKRKNKTRKTMLHSATCKVSSCHLKKQQDRVRTFVLAVHPVESILRQREIVGHAQGCLILLLRRLLVALFLQQGAQQVVCLEGWR